LSTGRYGLTTFLKYFWIAVISASSISTFYLSLCKSAGTEQVPDWNQILDEVGPLIWRQILRLLGNETDAADCFQEVMIEAFEVSRRETIRSWPGFLRRLATLRSLDQLRLRYRCASHAVPIDESMIAAKVSTHATLPAVELADNLRRALARLPKNQALAFSLRWIDGLTNDELAERMGITPNHAAVLLHRARATLRTLLGGDSIEDLA
jgi:RNA polymerase sigma-70 factor (ECF subfamily)